jgi:hypothetical protein
MTALTTGPVTRSGRDGRAQLDLAGADVADVEVAGRAPTLPRFAEAGAIVDLAEFDRVVGIAVADEQLEVWLADAGDNEILAELRQRGVHLRENSTVDEVRTVLNRQGPAGVRRFQLGVFGLGVLIAAVALLLLAGVERRGRATELAALRRQGLPARTVHRVSLLGYAAPAAVGVAAGLAAAAATFWLPVPRPAVFSDGWAVLAPPSGISTLPFVLSAAATTLLVALVLGYAARHLNRQALTDGGVR